jgi:carbonic anhydrase
VDEQDLQGQTPSMADMAKLGESKAHTPAEAIQLLKEGNERFHTGRAEKIVVDAFERRQQIVRQTPFAVVLGCSDSRVPVEIVMDQGPGNLFVVRVAGNVAETSALATIEFAIHYLQIKAVVVLGHEGCSAVQLALRPWIERQREPRLVRELVESVVPGTWGVPETLEPSEKIRAAVKQNVRRQVERLSRQDVFGARIRDGELAVAGAYYEIASGKVEFFHEP